MESTMSDEKKLAFIHKMAHLALSHVAKPQHFDAGGTVLAGPTSLQPRANTTSGGIGGAIGSFLGTNNNFQAGSAPIQNGTNTGQLNNAYNGAQEGLNSATNLNNTLAPGVAQGAGAQGVLSNQLAAETVGGGPNPAQAMLNLNTGNNVANQAALMASQRGASANPGLLATEAARNGGAIQQEAVGQGAALEAQQRLNAQNALATLSGQQVGQGAAATGLLNTAQQGEQGILQGANTAANNANVSMQSNINNVNAGVSEGNQKSTSGIVGGIANGIGAITGLFANGGEVPDHISKMAMIYHPKYALGGEVRGRNVGIRLKSGGQVPGKPMVSHDAYKNDTVDAKLSPGEVVIDLDTMKDKGKLGKMARYVAQNIARKKAGRAA